MLRDDQWRGRDRMNLINLPKMGSNHEYSVLLAGILGLPPKLEVIAEAKLAYQAVTRKAKTRDLCEHSKVLFYANIEK